MVLHGSESLLVAGLERRLFELLFATWGQREGMRAFAEKRSLGVEGR